MFSFLADLALVALTSLRCPFDVNPSLVVAVVPILLVAPVHISERANDAKQDIGVVNYSTEEAWVLDAACGGHNEIAEL